MAESKTTYDKIISAVKILASIISGVVLSFVWFEGYLEKSIDKMVTTAFVKQIEVLKNDVHDMKPLVLKHEKILSVLSYRMEVAEKNIQHYDPHNKEAILPIETKIEGEE